MPFRSFVTLFLILSSLVEGCVGDPAVSADINDPEDTSWVELVEVSEGEVPLRLLLTDAPVDADNVWVTFCGVHVQAATANTDPGDGEAPEEAGVGGPVEEPGVEEPGNGEPTEAQEGEWIVISEECQTLDLLALQDGVTEVIGLSGLPAGEYGQLRLMITEGSVVVEGEAFELRLQPGLENGFLVSHGFVLEEGLAMTITLDFDAERSVHYSEGQGYMLSPTVEVIGEHTASYGESRPEGAGAEDAPQGPEESGSRPEDSGSGSEGNGEPPEGSGSGSGEAGSGSEGSGEAPEEAGSSSEGSGSEGSGSDGSGGAPEGSGGGGGSEDAGAGGDGSGSGGSGSGQD